MKNFLSIKIMSQSRTENGSSAVLDDYLKTHKELIDDLPCPVIVTDTFSNMIIANAAVMQSGIELSVLCDYLIRDPGVTLCEGLPHETNKSHSEIHIPSTGHHFAVYVSSVHHKGFLIGRCFTLLDITSIRKQEKEHAELVDIYAHAVNDIKSREQKALIGREAFLNMLEDLNDSYKELEQLFLRLIRVMINVLDAKSPWTKGHSERVSLYAEQIALQMKIDNDEIKNIRLAGLLHDIGKIGTYDYLLDKPGRLTPEEFEIVKKHPAQGAVILRDIKQLMEIIPLIEYHHEKMDGTGYPHGLEGEDIPLGAKILHVADSFDSMTSDRPYRVAPGIDFALSELNKYKGTQFDPQVVDAFLNVLERQLRPGSLKQYLK